MVKWFYGQTNGYSRLRSYTEVSVGSTSFPPIELVLPNSHFFYLDVSDLTVLL